MTLTAADEVPNTASCSFQVTLVDATPPILTCPANVSVPGDANCAVTLANYVPSTGINDNCDPNPSLSQSPAPGLVFTGSQVVTMTGVDASGNSSTCNFTVTVSDNTPPVVNCPPSVIRAGDANCSVTLPDFTTGATATDNCTPPSFSQIPGPGTIISGENFVQNMQIVATDAAGNSASCGFTVTIADSTPPVVTCPPDRIIGGDTACDFILVDFTGFGGGTDNCDPSLSFVQAPPPGPIAGAFGTVQPVLLTGFDNAGNQDTCSFNITITDSLPPTAICPPNDTVPADGNCTIEILDYTKVTIPTDNCTVSPILTQVPAPGGNSPANISLLPVTILISDTVGLLDTCNFFVTKVDITPPSFGFPPCLIDQIVVGDANCQGLLRDYRPDVSPFDNCDSNLTLIQTPPPGTLINGTVSVDITAIDAAGNSAICTFNVNVADSTPPQVTCPPNQLVAGDGICDIYLYDYTSYASTSDNCDPNPNLTQVPAPGTQVSGLGTSQSVTISSTDAVGNASSCSFNVTVVDSTDPFVTCPPNSTLPGDANCNIVLPDYTPNATVSDNCDLNPALVQTPPSGTLVNGLGTVTTITITATDLAGNTHSCTHTVTITDVTRPIINCPPNAVRATDANCNYSLGDFTPGAITGDNCSPVGLAQAPGPGTVLSGAGSVQAIVITATDASGNNANCVMTVTLADSTNPVPLCPGSISVAGDAQCRGTIGNYVPISSATDNCDPNPALFQNPSQGTLFSGVLSVQITATDASGNSDICTFPVIVVDSMPPVLACPPQQVVAGDNNCQGTVLNYVGITGITDNCDPNPAVSQSPAPGTLFSGGTTVTMNGLDASGNPDTCSFSVIVADSSNPIPVCPVNNITVAGDSICQGTIGNYVPIGFCY